MCRRLVVGFSSLVDALLPFRSGGCFAAVVGCSGGCFATFVRPLTFGPWTLLFLLAGSVVGFWFVVWVVLFVIPVLLCCCSWCLCVFLSVCTFFQCFFIFSPLWSCVGQSLFGRIKIVSVTAFFLMKNVLRHGREKKVQVRIRSTAAGVVRENHYSQVSNMLLN